MKKTVVFIFIIMLCCITSFAQTEKRNIIKMFPTSPLFGKTTFAYERVLNENSSFTFNLGLPTGIDPFIYTSSTDDEFDFEDGKIDGFLLMPGYRFNLSKKGAPLGFCFEPYLKYEQFGLELDGVFIDDEYERFQSNLDGTYSGFGVGFQIGVLCLISEVVSVEWSIIGLEAKLANAEVLYKDLDGGVDLNDVNIELEDIFSDIPLIGNHMEYEKGSDYIKAKASNFFLPGVRTAFSIGIAF